MKDDRPKVAASAGRTRVSWSIAVVCVCVATLAVDDVRAAGDGSGRAKSKASCTPKVVTGGVACITADGEQKWTHIHPSLWGEWGPDTRKAFERREDAELKVELATVGKRIFYSVRRDVLEVDDRGRIQNRARFPARIQRLQQGESGRLEIDLRISDEAVSDAPTEPIERTLTVSRDPDAVETPAQMFWSHPKGRFSARKDMLRLVERHVEKYPDLEDAERGQIEEAIERLEEARDRDSTNPFYAEALGNLHRAVGDTRASERAFGEAARNDDAVWEDLLWLSTELHSQGATDASATAYETARAKMDEVGIASSRVRSLLAMQMAFMFPRDMNHPVHEALVRRDVEVVDRLSRRVAELFPNLEGGAHSWSALADWFEERERDELARKWRRRADANREANRGMLRDRLKTFDYYILALPATALALALVAMVVGLRGGVARARRDDPHDAGLRRWLPLLRWRDLAGPFALCFALVGLLYAANAELYSMQRFAETPGSVARDSLASPVVVSWFESFEQSSARRKLLEAARAEKQAMVEGKTLPEKRPVFPLYMDALDADAWQAQKELVWRGRLPQPSDTFNHDFTTRSIDDLTVGLPAWLLGLLVGMLVAIGVVGAILGQLLPTVSKWMLRLTPGAMPRAAPLGFLMVWAVCAAVLSLLGIGSTLHATALPEFYRNFGLSSIAPLSPPSPQFSWVWGSATAALAVHIWLVKIAEL